MSVRASTWAWEQSIPPNGKLVLMALADHAHDDGSEAYPSVALVARKTGYGPRQVQRILAELVNRGVIRVQRPGGRGNTKPTVYALNISSAFNIGRADFKTTSCPPQLRLDVIERDKQTCTVCHEPGDEVMDHEGNPWEADRIVAGGSYVLENVRLACRSCNRRRKRQEDVPFDVFGQDDAPGIAGGQGDAPGTSRRPERSDASDLRGTSSMTSEPSFNPQEPSESSSSGASSVDRGDPALRFLQFWEAYPRKVGKQAAERLFIRLAAKGVDLSAVVAGARRLADDPNLPEMKYVPHPATWLNGGRWDDPPYPPREDRAARPSTTDRRVQDGLDLAQRLAEQERGDGPPQIGGPQ